MHGAAVKLAFPAGKAGVEALRYGFYFFGLTSAFGVQKY